MVGTTLVEIRTHIEELASEDGDYAVVCARTGERPVPTESRRFGSRTTARAAARATEQYRAALRRYDPRLPYYDLIVCQGTPPSTGSRPVGQHGRPADDWDPSTAVADPEPSLSERRRLVEFCHRVAAAVFETLSEKGHDDVESTVMDAYFELAETLTDPDDLCLCLLESVATALDDHLTPAEQRDVIARAADRLAPTGDSDAPVAASLTRLREFGLLGEFTCSPASVDLECDGRSVVADLSGYVLSPRDGRLPVLPVAVELYRRRPDWSPSAIHVAAVDGEWRVTVEFARESEPDGLASAPIRSGA